jgi:hypothetical protein
MDELGADDDDLGADDDEDMDELGYSAIGTRNAYRRNVKDLFQALERGKSDKVRKNWIQIKEIYAKLDSNEKAQVKKPDAILASAGKLGQRELQLLVFATGKTKKQILGLGKVKAKEAAAAAEAAELEAAEAEAMGFAYGADDLPDDDSDIDSVLGADDDDDMDDLGADEDEGDDDFGVAGTLLAITAARRIGLGNPTAYAKYRRQFEKKVLKDRSTRGANLDWKQITSSWEKMKADEKKGLPSPQEFLADVAMKDFKGAVAGSGLDQTAVRKYVEKRKAALKGSKAYAMAYGADDLPDDDSDIDAVLGADDDDDMDDLGADDEDDDDFGIDEIEMDLDLDMQRALVNRYSGADAPFPAGGAAPFPGPRMAGSEVF